MAESCSPTQIVLAEDNATDVRMVREVLNRHNIHCDLKVLEDGDEALAFIDKLDLDLESPCPDLLLLDLHLPKRDGEEVLRYLRGSERCAQTPVVVLTSSDSPHDRESAEKNAALHYFRKPITVNQFMALGLIVKEVIARASAS